MIKIFNTFGRKKVEFSSIKEKKLGFYVCGPTVYDIPHLGHGRSAVSFDLIRRYFEYKGYEVNFVSNYTDIDDKMINRANDEGISVEDLANKVIPEYEKDYAALFIKKPSFQPRATEYIDSMIFIIKKLEEKGFIYSLDDGVYFDVEKFDGYGKLSGQKLEDLMMGARVEVKESKRNPYDFALWKFKKEGEPFWGSPWGDGRPGWHIECSAMSYKILGESFDIHGGGLDLVFPHHECEVAQSQGAFGENASAKYWIHNGFINVDNEKMSKSLGNFSTLRDVFENYDPQVVRFMFLQTHYRNPVNFSWDLLEQAKAGLERIHNFVRSFDLLEKGLADSEAVLELESYEKEFEKFMDNDFDSSGALGVLFNLIKNFNKIKGFLTKQDLFNVKVFLRKIDEVFCVIFKEDLEKELDFDIDGFIRERDEARKNKDYAKADAIRDELLEKGIVLEDSADGVVWRFK